MSLFIMTTQVHKLHFKLSDIWNKQKNQLTDLITHAFYLSNLAANNFCFLFTFVKNKMPGDWFSNSEVTETHKSCISVKKNSAWHICFEIGFSEWKSVLVLKMNILKSNFTSVFYVLFSKT